MAHDPAESLGMRGKLRGAAADLAIAALAARQQDVFSREQLLAVGIDRHAIDRRLRSGHIRRVYRGIYTVRQSGLHREGRWMAAVLLAGGGAVLSHRSAAALWGVRRG